MYDLTSNNPNSIINYDGITKNVTRLGFQEDGKWMYSGGEDCNARVWDLRATNQPCVKSFEVPAPVTSVVLHPNQVEMFIGDQSGIIHRWDMKANHNEQLVRFLYNFYSNNEFNYICVLNFIKEYSILFDFIKYYHISKLFNSMNVSSTAKKKEVL